MTGTATHAASVVTATDEDWPCSTDGCTLQAVFAVRFHNQAGHVHDCTPCTARLSEWASVAEVLPLLWFCPFPHTGHTWTDQPRELT